MFNLEFLITKKCNQTCYYCNNSIYQKEDNLVEIDLDYIDWVLEIYNKYHVNNIRIEISGGEPGIAKNFLELIDLFNSKNYISKIFLLSNGLIRKRFGNDIKSVIGKKFDGYQEHTALEIRDKDILYFYPELTFYNSSKDTIHVVVLNEQTITSLLNNFDYYNEKDLYKCNIDFKLITPKVFYPNNELINKSKEFYDKLKSIKNISSAVNVFVNANYKNFNKKLNTKYTNICSKISMLQFIDVENKLLGQCSMQVEQCNKAAINEENIKKALKGILFEKNEFCKNCYKYNEKLNPFYIERLLNKNSYNNMKG